MWYVPLIQLIKSYDSSKLFQKENKPEKILNKTMDR